MSPLEVVVEALAASSPVFDARRTHARKRQALSSPRTQSCAERELIKSTKLAAALLSASLREAKACPRPGPPCSPRQGRRSSTTRSSAGSRTARSATSPTTYRKRSPKAPIAHGGDGDRQAPREDWSTPTEEGARRIADPGLVAYSAMHRRMALGDPQ